MKNNISPCYNCDGEGEVPSDVYLKWKTGHEPDGSEEKECCSKCNGDGELFYIDGDEEKFNCLVDRWERETGLSSKIETKHPCFVEAIKMRSKEAVGYALKRLQKEEGSWFVVALLSRWVNKNQSPITEEMAGKLIDLKEAWLSWGVEKKFIEK